MLRIGVLSTKRAAAEGRRCPLAAGERERTEHAARSPHIRSVSRRIAVSDTNLELPIEGLSHIGPDSVDLRVVEGAAPGRHLPLAVEHRIAEAAMILGAQPAQVECHSATCVVQASAVAAR